jgi:hypothetical protein
MTTLEILMVFTVLWKISSQLDRLDPAPKPSPKPPGKPKIDLGTRLSALINPPYYRKRPFESPYKRLDYLLKSNR